jgi:hypothetical protein
VLSRLFTNKHEPNELAINEFLDQAMCAPKYQCERS